MTPSALIGKLIDGVNLTFEEMQSAMRGIMEGEWTAAQIGAFLIGLRIKGETPVEIAAAVTLLRAKATAVPTSKSPLVDTCGTGGDHSGTFNISTASAIVAAAAGVAVAKHGNRAVSSSCGSANVLQELGVNLDLSAEQVGACIDACGIGFLYAPRLHSAMKHVIGPRQELGQRTLFNLLGPMLNPARAKRQIIGVYDLNLTRTMAEVLRETGSEHVLVVAGTDGLDELTLTAPTKITELKNGELNDYILNPQDLGFSLCELSDLRGGDPAANANLLRSLFDGKKGPALDIVLLNAGAALYVGGVVSDISAGIAKARSAVADGAAKAKLEEWSQYTRSVAA